MKVKNPPLFFGIIIVGIGIPALVVANRNAPPTDQSLVPLLVGVLLALAVIVAAYVWGRRVSNQYTKAVAILAKASPAYLCRVSNMSTATPRIITAETGSLTIWKLRHKTPVVVKKISKQGLTINKTQVIMLNSAFVDGISLESPGNKSVRLALYGPKKTLQGAELDTAIDILKK